MWHGHLVILAFVEQRDILLWAEVEEFLKSQLMFAKKIHVLGLSYAVFSDGRAIN